MTPSPEDLRELRSLTVKLHEGQLTDEECLRLKTQLAASAESRRVFSEYAAMVALLEVELPTMKSPDSDVLAEENADMDAEWLQSLDLDIQESVDSSSHRAGLLFTAFQNGVSFFSQEVPFALLVATVLTSLGLWGASLVYVSQPDPMVKDRGTPLPAAVLSSEREYVGCITSMVGVKWGAGNAGNSRLPTIHEADWKSGIRNSPSPIALGDKFALASGLIEISYDTGAKVILQGPCLYEVDSREGGFLTVGKLTARLEKRSEVRGQGTEKVASEANPKSQIIKSQISNPQSLIPNPSLSTIHYPLFTIKTPTATVTDLGTEFGVEVQPSGLTSAYVFQGVVEMQSNDKGSSRVRLTAQEAGQVDGGDAGVGTVVRRIKIDPALFVRSEQLQKQANTAEDDRQMASFHRWQAYSRKLRRVSSLVAYYDFQQQKNKPTLLVNVAERTQGSCDGVVDGAAWCNGRMPGKQALWFQKPTDHVRIDLPQKLNDLTLTAWLSFDMLEAGGQRISGLVMSDDTRLHWQVGNWDGHLCLYAGDRDNAEGWQVVQPYQYHQWMHLACTYDHVTGNVAFYCNGRFAGARTWPAGEPIVIGPAWIGGWKNATRNFQGRIDELAIFSRSLSVQEVLQMYRNGKP